MRERMHAINFFVSNADDQKIDDLAEMENVSRSEAVRASIRFKYEQVKK